MTDKEDNHVQRVLPPAERDPQKRVLPPDETDYRQRSARERTSALPPDRAYYRARSDRERTSALPPDHHDPEKSALPPDKANHPETVVLPPQGGGADQQEAERYYAEHVQLGPEAGGNSLAALQEALNKGARHSRKLVGMVHDPTSQANVILVWDTKAFISG
jgi:hypothetical protein